MNAIVPGLMMMCVLTGCGQSNGSTSTPSSLLEPARPTTERSTATATNLRTSQPVPAWDATACGDDDYRNTRMERYPDLMSRTADDLLAAYGRPRSETRFAAGDGVGTYSGGVASQLPGGAKRNARTPVRELVWQRGDCQFIVRFRQTGDAWRVFDAFKALASADF